MLILNLHYSVIRHHTVRRKANLALRVLGVALLTALLAPLKVLLATRLIILLAAGLAILLAAVLAVQRAAFPVRRLAYV